MLTFVGLLLIAAVAVPLVRADLRRGDRRQAGFHVGLALVAAGVLVAVLALVAFIVKVAVLAAVLVGALFVASRLIARFRANKAAGTAA